jgi:glycosyltransferase involved in cell wall biosynthesis
VSQLVSIIIPVYNHAHTLARCLASIEQQTYRPLEVIVVNDGSTDNFDEVIKTVIPAKAGIQSSTLRNLDSRFRGNDIDYNHFTQPHSGAPAARNFGFSQSTGDYVIFWDADTVARPEMLEKMMTILQNNPSASYAYSGYKFGWKIIKPAAFNAERLKQSNYIDGTSLLRRADFGGFDESLKRFQDWDLWLTLLEKNKTGLCVPEILYTKIVKGRRGISAWLPRFIYKLPWKIKSVRDFEAARVVIGAKHHLLF